MPAEMPNNDEGGASQTLSARAEGVSRRVRIAALLLIAGLVAGPASTHVYWLLGGTWGLYTNGVHDEVATTGTRVVAAIVIVLLIAAVSRRWRPSPGAGGSGGGGCTGRSRL